MSVNGFVLAGDGESGGVAERCLASLGLLIRDVAGVVRGCSSA